MYDAGGDRRWEPRQSWYDHLYEGWVLGPYYFTIGLLSLLVIPFVVLYAWLSHWEGSLFNEFCFGMWRALSYMLVGLLGVLICPFLVIWSWFDERFRSMRR